jgi:ribosomal protein S18 acetylase RimI-like enzyme
MSEPEAPTSAHPAPPVVVSEATETTPELVEAFERLVPHLSKSNPPPTAEEVAAMVASDASIVLIARDPERDDEIVGTLTLAIFRIPTGLRAWIEDVIVDPRVERRGIGAALTNAAVDRARAEGAKTVDLTSRPSREAANRLYRRVGFEVRDTNVYRHTL